MIIDVKVPSPGESINEVQLANWLVEDGSFVEKDIEIAEIDSDKATLSIAATDSGRIQFLVKAGDRINVGSVIARIDTVAKASSVSKPPESKKPEVLPRKEPVPVREERKEEPKPEVPAMGKSIEPEIKPHLSPLAKKLLAANGLNEADLVEFIRNYRFSKPDIEFFISEKEHPKAAERTPVKWGGTRDTERKKMSTLRLKLAERLVAVKNETAMLTTFNEVNMSAIMAIRETYKDAFKANFGISLGFMSFFIKAVTEALQYFPQVNAQVDGDEVEYHNFVDMGIAVSTPKGLMVPVLRNAETMTIPEIELKVKELATKTRDNKITLDEMKGGTFTITNGGVFGSMLSTPILNPPQSAILGMHNIVDRPIAVNGQVEIHPIMYVALSYDHRIIDGSESVTFLVKVKEMLENPARMLFRGSDPVQNLLGI
jgi:2-oxoglutarate dehydrogenase E2 component (dihydrolipoamide succinyltransferase)